VKVLHTSDWHLGARLGRHDRLTDQRIALRGLLDIAEETQPDLILHTGDVFDSPRPPYEALQLGAQALARLAGAAPTVVVSGNHDSPQLLRIIHSLAGMAESRRLWMVTRPEVLIIPGLDHVAVACVPFIPLTAIADLATGDPSRFEGTYADGIRHVNERLLTQAADQAGPRGTVLYAAHLYVHGARPGRSERRISVGEDYATHAEGLHRAMYVALGHIHDPQLVPGGAAAGRYAGSLVPIDFGEAIQGKIALVVTIEGSDVTVREYPLPAGRPLTEFNGTPEELEALAADGGLNGRILKARVRSEDPVSDLAERVLRFSPECAIFDMVNIVANAQAKPIDTSQEPDSEPDIRQLFAEWRNTATYGITASHDDVADMFARAIGGEQVTVAELGIQDIMTAAREALGELAAARNGGTGRDASCGRSP
jgi:DNA repair protein SbcD/Mre11